MYAYFSSLLAGSPVYPIVIGGLKVYNLGKVHLHVQMMYLFLYSSMCHSFLSLCSDLPEGDSPILEIHVHVQLTKCSSRLRLLSTQI